MKDRIHQLRYRGWQTIGLLAVLLAGPALLRAERIKDIADVKGVRGNPLWGLDWL